MRDYDEPTAWWNMLFEGGFEFRDPSPNITADGTVEPFPSLHIRRLDSRTAMSYEATGITPAMCMHLTNVGSQYLAANLDRSGQPLDGAKIYRLLLPPGIPAAAFGSVTVYDKSDTVHAADAPTAPASRQPELSHAGRRRAVSSTPARPRTSVVGVGRVSPVRGGS